MNSRTYGACLSVVLLSGCSGGSGGVDAGPTLLNCGGVFTCSAACPTSPTSTCEDACLARATAAASEQLNAILACNSAQQCNSETACLRASCGAQLAACEGLGSTGSGGGAGTDGGSGGGGGSGGDGFPNRFIGTVSDTSNVVGTLESTGNATFVRDDQADTSGEPGAFAFYRLETVTYVAKASGTAGACTQSASETVTVNAPPASDNSLSIRKVAGADGQWLYFMSTQLSTLRPGALTLVCSGVAPRTADFPAELNVSTGVPTPKTNSRTQLKGTGSVQAGRTWAWDLTGAP